MSNSEIGLVKDILWYLRGAIELRGIYELKDYHLVALNKIIEEIQGRQNDRTTRTPNYR